MSFNSYLFRGHHGRDHIVVGFITNLCNQCLLQLTLGVRISLRRGLINTTLCVKVCQWLATGRWFSPCTLVSSTNNTNCHDITEILLKVALKTITLTFNTYLHIHIRIKYKGSEVKILHGNGDVVVGFTGTMYQCNWCMAHHQFSYGSLDCWVQWNQCMARHQ